VASPRTPAASLALRATAQTPPTPPTGRRWSGRRVEATAAEAIHLVRVIRSAPHGFVSLELGGGFGIPLFIDESFDLLVDSIVAAIEAVAPSG